MADDNFHFQIPASNIRNEKLDKTGGGTTYQRRNHAAHGRKLLEQTGRIVTKESQKKDSEISQHLYVQIETPESVSIKNEKSHLEALGFDLLSISHANQSLGVAKIEKAKIDGLLKRLESYSKTKENLGKTYFSGIENLTDIPAEARIDEEININSKTEVPVIFNLYSSLTPKEKFSIQQTLKDDLKNFSENLRERNFSNGASTIACKIASNLLPQIANNFSTIKEIKINHVAYIPNSTPFKPSPATLEIRPPKSSSTICIIDTGVNTSAILGTLVNSILHLPSGASTPAYGHGTFVASRCLFGDNIASDMANNILYPYCRILDIPVFGNNAHGKMIGPDEVHLCAVIEEIVITHHGDIKVYNISIGRTSSIKSGVYCDLAKLLDFLSKKYKVLFIIASGNISTLLGNYPNDHFYHLDARIGSPGESLLSLTVGAIAKVSLGTTIASINEISPFSRIGPGSDNGIKPELVAHGGNFVHVYSGDIQCATYGIAEDGASLAVDNGTSFAAPIIATYAQRLFDAYPISDPNLVKALLCHFTEQRHVPNQITGAHERYVGFGEPNIESALTAGSHNAAYIYEGQIQDDAYQYIDFDVPPCFAPESQSKLKVKITITYDPPVNPDNNTEYSQTRISAALYKVFEGELREVAISGNGNYLVPWNPTIKFEKTFIRNFASGKWSVRLRLYTRGNIPADYKQDFAIVIELIDENSVADIYNDILTEFGSLYKKIEIRIAA